jgi:hypothetical protein
MTHYLFIGVIASISVVQPAFRPRPKETPLHGWNSHFCKRLPKANNLKSPLGD